MKIVFLALLLVNLGLLAWHFWIVPPAAAPAAPLASPDVPRLRLWHPPPPASIPAPVAPSPASSAPQPSTATMPMPSTAGPTAAAVDPPVCAEYGPFEVRSAATAVANALEQRQFAATIASRATPIIESYWVYFPPFPSRAAAAEMASRLKRRGVKDYYIVPDGAMRNAVSVGVYHDRPHAVRRRQQVLKLGFKPRLGTRGHDEPRFWVTAQGDAARALPAPASIAAPRDTISRTTDCSSVAVPAVKP